MRCWRSCRERTEHDDEIVAGAESDVTASYWPPIAPTGSKARVDSLSMRATDVEQWCTKVVDHLQRGLRVEDDRVELKRELPSGDVTKAARRIAGHANQARSDRILWIIGAEEDPTPRVTGVVEGEQDVADWWVPVEARFDDVAPSPTIVRLTVEDGLAVVAIGFETTRPPYVIKHGSDLVNREVPWREGTRVRTANRSDLLRLLVPVVELPRIAHLDSYVRLRPAWGSKDADSERRYEWRGSVVLYMDTERTVILPDHRCHATLLVETERINLSATPYVGRALGLPDHIPDGRLATRGDGQLLIGGSAAIKFELEGESDANIAESLLSAHSGRIDLRFDEAGLDPASFAHQVELKQEERDETSTTWTSGRE